MDLLFTIIRIGFVLLLAFFLLLSFFIILIILSGATRDDKIDYFELDEDNVLIERKHDRKDNTTKKE